MLRVRHLDDGDLVEVDTPNLAFNLQRTGEYRIDVDSAGNVTNVNVWSGRGEVRAEDIHIPSWPASRPASPLGSAGL
jgi:hypothetical protein